MPLPEGEDRPTPAELADRIAQADRPSRPQPNRLRFQWNVPRGVKPFVPLWLPLVFLGLFALIVVTSLLSR